MLFSKMKATAKNFKNVEATLLHGNSSDASLHDVNITTYLYAMFKKRKYTDVELAVKKELGSECASFSAHKLILSIWSPYFADILNGPDQKMDNIITIEGVDPAAFGAMLRFMYGVLPAIKTCKEALEIYKVSERFGIQFLNCASCQRVQEIQPEIGNIFEVLEASIYMNLVSKKEDCLKVIQEKTTEVFALDVTQISPSLIREILNLNTFHLASEYDLIKFIFRWAKSRFFNICTCSNLREVIQEFFPKLHFTSLSSKEFAQFYKIHEIFFDQEEAFKILMNIALPESLPLPEWHDSEFNFRVYKGQRLR